MFQCGTFLIGRYFSDGHYSRGFCYQMDFESCAVDRLRRDIINSDLSVKSVIQEIYKCDGPLHILNDLNAEGRAKLASLRNSIDKLELTGKEKQDNDIVFEAQNLKEQYHSTFSAFRKANVAAMLSIEKIGKEELFQMADEQTILKRRQRKDKASLVKMSSGITDQLFSISRLLADTTQRSADTLNTLATSSTNVLGTQEELQMTHSAISQSGKLLAKYSRRQFTDKLIILLGFAFFMACVFYIIQKRLF